MENWLGFWPATVLMIVVASWILYRYAAPASWKEWTSAGLVQAFIVAFYAEMYGFPLTIYLLTRVFGLDVAGQSGNLWSNLFGTELAMYVAMIAGYLLVLFGVAMLAEGWRELYNAKRQDRLAMDGLYGVVRHPQYTGIFLALFGEGIVHWPTIFSVALFPVIVVAYAWLARNEERQMAERFGDQYRAYQRRVPMFFPRWTQWRRLIRAASPTGHTA